MLELDATPPSRGPRWRPDRDLVLSLAAVVVSACALGVSLVQTAVMRAQQHAAVWPRLTTALDANPDSATFALAVRNAGVGPAQVAWAQVTFDGVPLDGWPALIERAAAGAPGGSGRGTGAFNSLTGSVLVPAERLTALRLAGDPARFVFGAAERVGLRVCYCSVFDRCWRLDDPSVGARVPRERAAPVSACPRPAGPVL
jgi:hypothetical protein